MLEETYINAIFDALGKTAQICQIKDQYQNKLAQIESVQAKRCGNCEHWMKSSCVPEKEHRQFKSIGSLACKDFSLAHSSEYMIKEFTDELRKIELNLKESLRKV